ncbi:HupE/UreJ family protein, partial [Sulfurimonas sp. RIFOXYB12_FULL_35_9]
AAHGFEMPLNVGGVEYAAGFILATAMLHAAGITLGSIMHKIAQSKISRIAGGSIAVAGLALAIS